MRDRVTEEDVGKPVVHGGERVGKVVDYENDTPFVDPNPGIAETVAAKLGLEEHGKRAIPLRRDAVTDVTDEEIRLRVDL